MTSCAKTSHPIRQRLQQSCWDQIVQERLLTHIQDQLWTGMDRNKVGKWVWSPASPQHSGRVSSSVLMHCEEEEEEPEEEAGGGPDVCCYTSGNDIICQWIPYQAPWGSGLAQQRPEAPHQSKVVLEGDAEDKAVSQHSVSGCWWEGPEEPETQECVCQQREPERLAPSWPGCTYAYSGVRRNLLIGLEVVEEVAIEDTVELITDNIYTDHLQGQLYPPCSHLFQDPASPDLHSKSSTI